METKTTVGFIGLGNMGKPMAENVLKAGYPLVVYNRTASKAASLQAAGARVAASPAEAAKGADVTITMVSDPAALEAVVLGPNGVLAGARRGSTLVDMSTVSPAAIAKIAAAAQERGVRLLESPVTGGVSAAAGGSLTLMVGGDADLLERLRPLLSTMATKIVHLGPLGAGSNMKLATQVLGAAIVVGLAEVMAFGVKAGLDPAAMLEVLSERSRLVASRTKPILTGDFRPQFSTQLAHKDVTLALEAARGVGAPMFLGAAVREVLTAGMAKGLGDQDYASIVTLFEGLTGVSCRAK